MNENEERNLTGDIYNGDIITKNTVANTTEYNGDIKNTTTEKVDINPRTGKPKRKMNPASIANLRPIQPGEVRNPGGRPKTPDEVKQKLKDALGEAVDRLIELSKNADKDSVKYQATQDLIDRVLGKPTQPLDIDQANAVRVEFVGGTDDLAK